MRGVIWGEYKRVLAQPPHARLRPPTPPAPPFPPEWLDARYIPLPVIPHPDVNMIHVFDSNEDVMLGSSLLHHFWKRSQGCTSSTSWLSDIPAPQLGLEFSSATFRILFEWWLGFYYLDLLNLERLLYVLFATILKIIMAFLCHIKVMARLGFPGERLFFTSFLHLELHFKRAALHDGALRIEPVLLHSSFLELITCSLEPYTQPTFWHSTSRLECTSYTEHQKCRRPLLRRVPLA